MYLQNSHSSWEMDNKKLIHDICQVRISTLKKIKSERETRQSYGHIHAQMGTAVCACAYVCAYVPLCTCVESI